MVVGLEGTLNIEQMVLAIDEELARLTQVKALLAGSVVPTTTTRKASAQTTAFSPTLIAKLEPPVPSRSISPEGRARIAAAQKKRWKALHKAQRAASLPTAG